MTLRVTQRYSKVRRVLSGPIRAFSGKGLTGIDWGTMTAEEGQDQVSGGCAEETTNIPYDGSRGSLGGRRGGGER